VSKIVFINIGSGNLRSMINAFRRIDVDVSEATSADDLANASMIILPGVGAFGEAMRTLKQKKLLAALRQNVLTEGKPLLGICIGMQLLAESSDEHGHHEGLGFIKGHVHKLDPKDPSFSVPNIGWFDVDVKHSRGMFATKGEKNSYYFVHSHHFVCDNSADVSGTIDYSGIPVTAAIECGRIFGLQFHPEKSQSAGLHLLNNFFNTMKKENYLN
jgi:glutamine amidotransferase